MNRHKMAFTLVELLAAMAVLTMIVIAVAKIFSSSTQIYQRGTAAIDVNTEARAALNLLSTDLSQAIFTKQGTNSITLTTMRVVPDNTNPRRRSDELFFLAYMRDEVESQERGVDLVYYYLYEEYTLRRNTTHTDTKVKNVFGALDATDWDALISGGSADILENVWSFRIDPCIGYSSSTYSIQPQFSTTNTGTYYVNAYLEVLDEETMRQVKMQIDIGNQTRANELANLNAKRYSQRIYFNNQHGFYNEFR